MKCPNCSARLYATKRLHYWAHPRKDPKHQRCSLAGFSTIGGEAQIIRQVRA